MPIINNTKDREISGYDVCIIGSGPAGMTLCAELANSGKRVCILESGVFKKQAYADRLKKVNSTGEIKVKDNSRERVVGGTSTTWGGGSAPMDDVDFSARDFIETKKGWPISIEELSKYYKKTVKYGFPSFDLFYSDSNENVLKSTDDSFMKIGLDKKVFIAMDPPWNFGKKLINIFENKNVDLYTDASVVELKTTEVNTDLDRVSEVLVVTSAGFRWTMRAEIVVLACGGIESVRLLLLSKNSKEKTLGNDYDNVGRYIMNHPKSSSGIIKLNQPVYSLPYFFGYYFNGFAGFAGFRLDSESQIKSKVLNSYVRFEPIFPWSDNPGVWSFLTIVKKLKTLVNFWKVKQKNLIHLRDYNETPDSDGATRFSWVRAIVDILLNIRSVIYYCIHRVFPNISLPIFKIRLRNFMEMEPRRQNRIILSSDKDDNGHFIPEVILSTSELDRKSLIVLHNELDKQIRLNNIGKLEGKLEDLDDWVINTDASHHIGGAIMGEDPKISVVNSDLRVHQVSNLYVCSSSVFPTSGCANPTYTICALAIRLSDKIKV